jgi:hypothetical protein
MCDRPGPSPSPLLFADDGGKGRVELPCPATLLPDRLDKFVHARRGLSMSSMLAVRHSLKLDLAAHADACSIVGQGRHAGCPGRSLSYLT